MVAYLVILGHSTAAVLLSWFYFRHFVITRPPIGVFNLRDIAVMIGGIILVPYLYLFLPRLVVAGLLFLGTISAVYLLWEPVLKKAWAIWLVTLALLAADIGVARQTGATTASFFAINNLVLVLVIVGLTNLWAQSGMRAQSLAVLAGALVVYDLCATWFLPLMTDLFNRLAGLPFAPLLAWPVNASGLWMGIGMGDLLLAAGFPLVMRKAFGRNAGLLALCTTLLALAVLLLFPLLGLLRTTFPVMIVLGPLIVLQYLLWRRQREERTTWQYLQAEPR